MMKKLLVLLLVLGITSVANAGIIDIVIVSWGPGPDPVTTPIDPTKEITLNPSEWVNIDIIYSTDIETQWLSQCFVEVTLTGLASMYVDDLTFPVGAWDTDPMYTPGITEVVANKQYLLQYSAGMAGSGVPYPGGIAIDHILVHCDGQPGEVIITIADAAVGGIGSMENDPPGMIGMGLTYGGPITIIQVPEPMTIALLGLGGLFLLRRRK